MTAIWLAACGAGVSSQTTGLDVPTTSTTSTSSSTTIFEPPPVDTWDSSPPDAEVDDIVETRIFCGLLTTYDARIQWIYNGSEWPMDVVSSTPTVQAPLTNCVRPEEPNVLTWTDSEVLVIRTGGLFHTLRPGAVEGQWFGDVVPEVPSAECDTGIAEIGLSWPVGMSLILEVL